MNTTALDRLLADLTHEADGIRSATLALKFMGPNSKVYLRDPQQMLDQLDAAILVITEFRNLIAKKELPSVRPGKETRPVQDAPRPAQGGKP